MSKVLFLWGLSSGPRKTKSSYLSSVGCEVVEPDSMPYPEGPGGMVSFALFPSRFAACVRKAQDLLERCRPDVIVGSSFGGAVALNLASELPMVLIAPSWNWGVVKMGAARSVRASAIVLHSPHDSRVKFQNSLQLLRNSERSLGEGGRALCRRIGDALRQEGYGVEMERLIPVGRDHRCNEPDQQDRRNRNPDPLFALRRAIEIVSHLAEDRGNVADGL